MPQELEIYQYDTATNTTLPLFLSPVAAGFPSPADDFLDKKLDLNEHLIKHPASTFFVKVKGDSMVKAGIHPGDILVVDRSLEPLDKKIVIAILDGEFTVKRIQKKGSQLFLASENENYQPIEVTDGADFEIWGVVTTVIHPV